MRDNITGRISFSVLTAVSLTLVGCGGSGSDTPSNDPARLDATLVAPIQLDQNASASKGSIVKFHARMSECENVPEGYAPIKESPVSFLDENGNALPGAAVVTDECGFFSTDIPTGTSQISADSPGNKPLLASVSAIVASGGVASTIPADAEYRVGFLSAFDDTTLGFSITDTSTDKAVIGLATDAFSVLLDEQRFPVSSITTGIAGEQASIIIVTDASGSMGTTAFTDETTDISYSRLNVSAIAAHQFLDQKSPTDEIAAIIFDGDVNFMDQESVNTLLPLEDENAMEVIYPFPESGFSADSSQMRLIVDAYNEDTQMWGANEKFLRHPDTPQNLSFSSRYPWGGSTAFYSSTVLASDKLAERNNPRKFILAMTDGRNNRGLRDLQTVVDTANTNRTPVYTIGFEFSDEDDLTRLAEDTGATYFQANSLEISDAYNSIQTNILFQYVGTLPQSIGSTMTIELQLDINGDGVPEASRSISNTPTVN